MDSLKRLVSSKFYPTSGPLRRGGPVTAHAYPPTLKDGSAALSGGPIQLSSVGPEGVREVSRGTIFIVLGRAQD